MSNEIKDYGNGYNSENSIQIIWAIEDVRSTIEQYDLKIELTDDECLDVLYRLADNHDANLGICWDTIYYYLYDEYRDEIKKAEEEANEC